MPKPHETLNETLKTLRVSRKITQADWGKAAGVDQSQVARWEKGAGEPSIESLKGIAQLLGTTVASLIGDERPEFAPPREPSEAEMLEFLLSRFALPLDTLEAVRLLLASDPATIDNVLLILRVAAPSKKNRKSTAS